MNRDEFIKLIESIGFTQEYDARYYKYDDYYIYLDDIECNFSDGWKWIYNIDSDTICNYFKKELRAIKLKQLLK